MNLVRVREAIEEQPAMRLAGHIGDVDRRDCGAWSDFQRRKVARSVIFGPAMMPVYPATFWLAIEAQKIFQTQSENLSVTDLAEANLWHTRLFCRCWLG
jgi:hypothetical protein